MEHQVVSDLVAASNLSEVAIGQQRSVERTQCEEAVDDTFGVAHRDLFGRQDRGACERDAGHEDRNREDLSPHRFAYHIQG